MVAVEPCGATTFFCWASPLLFTAWRMSEIQRLSRSVLMRTYFVLGSVMVPCATVTPTPPLSAESCALWQTWSTTTRRGGCLQLGKTGLLCIRSKFNSTTTLNFYVSRSHISVCRIYVWATDIKLYCQNYFNLYFSNHIRQCQLLRLLLPDLNFYCFRKPYYWEPVCWTIGI